MAKSLYKILLIQIWFGKWPNWINLLIETCRHNHEIDWLIFSDQNPPINQSQNIKYIKITSSQIESLIAQKSGVEICLENFWKAGDSKVLFGVIFQEYIKGYDFWGYCDSDLMWGDIRNFLPEDSLKEFDIITACRCCICGQFTIFKNKEPINFLFQKAPYYKEKFKSNQVEHIDENLINEAALQEEKKGNIKVLRRQLQIHDCDSSEWFNWAKQLEESERGTSEGMFWLSGPSYWKNGKVFHEKFHEEAMFFHFSGWKHKWNLPYYSIPDSSIAGWMIDEKGIHMIFKSFQKLRSAVYFLKHNVPFLIGMVFKKVHKRFSRRYSDRGRH
ncbi:MAG: DUF6625 family protein [Candidatus Omnitrophota bacterium]